MGGAWFLLFKSRIMMGRREFSPIIDVESNEDASEMLFAKRRCCFCIPYSDRSSPAVGLVGLWTRGINSLKKLREWSEIVAGPKWKTFIRRFNRNKSGLGGGGNNKSSKFQYDPLSYALNFDEGPGQSGNLEEADDYLFRNFSSRYATVPAMAKGSMDLGKDGPSFS